KDSERKNDSFRKIEEASAHLLSLINNVLDMSKMEANKLELSPVTFSFNKMLEGVLNLIDIQMKEKSQTLQTEVDPHIPDALIGDDFRLSQVIINLLSNAIRFTDDQGTITLSVCVKENVNNIYTLQFEVSDTGIGISAEQQKKLFRMFEQADNSTSRRFSGTGLGLALSKRIVEIMGGEIWVESEVDKGSAFFFTVKLEKSADINVQVHPKPPCDGPDHLEQETEKPAVRDDPHDFSGKKILLAEDIEINREIVIAMLEATHVKIDWAVNGKAAYERFAANPAAYDLILMDIQMPVLDGVEATKLIRMIDKDVPIIALTANVFTEDVEHYLEIGITGHIGKPLDYDLTLDMLGKYLHPRHESDTQPKGKKNAADH
ncbi:response regulator, partial [Desulfosarcina sp. OttesenSCG-928-B08]|nr:response regulator [Desulfosarcina sp. OttesenSCG-928-B08]